MADLKTLVEREMERAGTPSYGLVDLGLRRDRRQRNRRLAAAIVATAVAVAGIGSLQRAFDRGVRPASLPSTSRDWERVVLDAAGPHEPNVIVAGGPGLVAGGSDALGAAVWTSADARIWDRSAGPDLGPGVVWDIATDGDRLVAVGAHQVGPDVYAVSWTSDDGLRWSRGPAFIDATFTNVTAGGPGFVVIGMVPQGPQAWSSTDGVTWEPAEVPQIRDLSMCPDCQEALRAEVWMSDVVAVGDRLVATGIATVDRDARADASEERLFIWTSYDGVTWTDVRPDPASFGPAYDIVSMTAGPEGLVGVGWAAYRQEIGVWISPDGTAWHAVPPEQDAFVSLFRYGGLGGFGGSPYERGGMRSIASNGAGYVAIGGDGLCPETECPDTELAVWTSNDGLTWDRIATAPVFRDGGPVEAGSGRWVSGHGVTAWGSRFVAWGSLNGRTALWISGTGAA